MQHVLYNVYVFVNCVGDSLLLLLFCVHVCWWVVVVVCICYEAVDQYVTTTLTQVS